MWEEQGITSVYQTLTEKKTLPLYFQLNGLVVCLFSYTLLVLAFSSIMATDLGFGVLLAMSVIVFPELNAAEEVEQRQSLTSVLMCSINIPRSCLS